MKKFLLNSLEKLIGKNNSTKDLHTIKLQLANIMYSFQKSMKSKKLMIMSLRFFHNLEKMVL